MSYLCLHVQAAEIEKKRKDFIRQATPPNEKQQFVCDVSGLIYASTDNEARIRDLQSGRQYIGWKKVNLIGYPTWSCIVMRKHNLACDELIATELIRCD